MKEIPLGHNRFAKVDDEDYEGLSLLTWHAHVYPTVMYAEHTRLVDGKTETLRMHQVVSGESGIDHADGDGLNNQKYNFRSATKDQQNQNRQKVKSCAGKAPLSKYKGVSRKLNKKGEFKGKWQAYISIKGRQKSLGYFWSEDDAAKAYDTAAFQQYGAFARFNFPDTFGVII